MGANAEGRAACEARLAALSLECTTLEHPPAMTVAEQQEYVGHLVGGHSKNLLLQDKKKNLYLLSALPDTKVDLRQLSTRLGHGKSGLRFANEEQLTTALGVPLGSATPLAVVHSGAKNVVFFLDEGFKQHELCHFHPMANDATTSLSPDALEKLLAAEGVTYSWIDVGKKAAVTKDSPPDLGHFVKNNSKAAGGAFGSAADDAAKSKGVKQQQGAKAKGKAKAAKGSDERTLAADLPDALGYVLEMAKQAGVADPDALRNRIEWRLQALKNGAFASGFKAGKGAATARAM